MFRRSSLLTAAGLLLVALPALVQAEQVKTKRLDLLRPQPPVPAPTQSFTIPSPPLIHYRRLPLPLAAWPA